MTETSTSATAVADELEIRNLVARVAHVTDGWGTMVDDYLPLWTDDCVWTSPFAGTWQGHDGHLARHARFREAGVQGPDAASYHVVTTVLITVDGDRGTGRSTWMLVKVAPEGNLVVQDAGIYADEYARTPTGWRISRRDVSHATDGGWLDDATSSLDS